MRTSQKVKTHKEYNNSPAEVQTKSYDSQIFTYTNNDKYTRLNTQCVIVTELVTLCSRDSFVCNIKHRFDIVTFADELKIISSIVSLTTHSSLLPFTFTIMSSSSIQKHEEEKNLKVASSEHTGHIN